MNHANTLNIGSILVGATLVLGIPTGWAQSSAPLACLIGPDQVAEVGTPVIGVLETVEVDRGDPVEKGQVIARLRADVERANAGVVRSRADAQAELRAAIAARDLAVQRYERAKKLKDQNFISAQGLDQVRSEFIVANEKVTQTREALLTAAEEVSLTQAQLSQRIVRSPIKGVIVERYVNPGERVEDRPLLKVAAITPLRVEVIAPTAMFGSIRKGDEASVHPELPGAKPTTAKVTQIDRVLDPASNTFRIRLILPNDKGELPAGLRCKVHFGSADGSAAITPAPAAGAIEDASLTVPARRRQPPVVAR
ncbi:MAG: efflux RND transporter periplasmic adaptor subunit [Burkholderiales bacterium]|nr:efflux RND transporter periplasmic adaptor subunit [Burkholderiales bacterium]